MTRRPHRGLAWSHPPAWLKWGAIALMVAGIALRFSHLGGKVYGHDEVYTSLRIGGNNGDAAAEAIFTGEILAPEDLLDFQQTDPSVPWADTWERLAEHPEHPPGYFLLARAWTEAIGDDPATLRALSAGLSLLAFPALYWFCWELFGGLSGNAAAGATAGWLAIALLAVSPAHVVYAQEARHYALWTATLAAAHAALLRALRLERLEGGALHFSRSLDRQATEGSGETSPAGAAWATYAILLAASFYTALLSAFAAIAQGIYAIASEGFRPTRAVRRFLLAGTAATVAFSPWLGVIANNWGLLQDKTAWLKQPATLAFLARMWGLHLSSAVVDLFLPWESWPYFAVPLAVLGLLLAAIAALVRFAPRSATGFLALAIAVPAAALVLPDLLAGGLRSSATRYFFPSLLGVEAILAWGFAVWLFGRPVYGSLAATRWRQRVGGAVLAIVLAAGLVSSALGTRAATWWNKPTAFDQPEAIAAINARATPERPGPLVVSDDFQLNVGSLLSASHDLDPQVRLLLTRRGTAPRLSAAARSFEDVLVLNPSPDLLATLKSRYGPLEPLLPAGSTEYWMLWRLPPGRLTGSP